MENKLKKYWQLSTYSAAIATLNINTIQDKIYLDANNYSKLERDNGELLLAPIVLMQGANIFCPFWLQIQVKEQQIMPNAAQLLPIFSTEVLDPFCSGYAISCLRDLEQMVILNPAEWKDNSSVTLSMQISYAKNILNKLTNNKWQLGLEQQGYNLLLTKMLVIEQSSILSNLDKFKLDNISKYTFNLEPTAIIAEVLPNQAIKAINLLAMPLESTNYMASLQHALNLCGKDFITIETADNCGKETWIDNYVANHWLSAAIHNTEIPFIAVVDGIGNYTLPTIFSINNIQLTSIHPTQLDCNEAMLHQKLCDLYYSDDASMLSHKMALNNSQKERLENLLTLWNKHLETTPILYKLFSFIPAINKINNQKRAAFLAKHLAEYDVSGFSTADLHGLLTDLIVTCNKKELALNTKYQNNSTLAKTNNNLSLELAKLLLDYWKSYYIKYNTEPNNKLAKFNPTNLSQNLFTQTNTQLIFTNANLIDSCSGILLATQISGACILFGNRELKYHSPVINQIEENNLLAAGIYQDTELYAELEYNCLLSMDNYFAHACSLAEDYAPMYQLNCPTSVAGDIGLARNALAHYFKLDFTEKPTRNNNPSHLIVMQHVIAPHNIYCGSKANYAEIDHIITWLQASKQLLEVQYSTTIEKILVIFTCFAGQKLALQNKLASHGLGNIQIKTVVEYVAASYPLVLFSPVSNVQDSGPFIFDEGNEIFYKILNYCTDQLIIFGDKNLFNLHRHSASGIVANYLSGAHPKLRHWELAQI